MSWARKHLTRQCSSVVKHFTRYIIQVSDLLLPAYTAKIKSTEKYRFSHSGPLVPGNTIPPLPLMYAAALARSGGGSYLMVEPTEMYMDLLH